MEMIDENKEKMREKKYFGPKQKKGGKTNKEKERSKPLMMMRPKKNN